MSTSHEKLIKLVTVYPTLAKHFGACELISRQQPWWKQSWQIIHKGYRADAVILDGSVGANHGYADLIAAGVLARLPNPPIVLIAECVWKADKPTQRRLRSLVIKLLAGRRTWFYVLSRAEVTVFSRIWRVDPAKVCFMPYYFTLPPEQLLATCHDDGYVFAGGNSMRDYQTLLSAVNGSGLQTIIATSTLDHRTDLPREVRAAYVSEEKYYALMRRASVVVVALQLREDRSAGQQTYLNAMALGKPVIVFDCFGVRDHVRHGETGWVIPPANPQALREALDYVLNPANTRQVHAVAAQAKEIAIREFNVGNFVDRLIADANDVVRSAKANSAKPANAQSQRDIAISSNIHRH